MKLFRISQHVNTGYDTYRVAVVVAKDIEQARRTHPAGLHYKVRVVPAAFDSWCGLRDVQVRSLGGVKKGSRRSILWASYNVG